MAKNKQSLSSRLFHIAAIAQTAFITLPITGIYFFINPNSRPHPQWSLIRSLFVSVYKSYRTKTRPLGIRSDSVDKRVLPTLSPKADATAIWIQSIDPKIDLQGDIKTMFTAGSCDVLPRNLVFWYGKDHSTGKQGKVEDSRRAEKGEKVILYFHGGGYYENSSTPTNPTMRCLRLLLAASSKSANRSSSPHRALSVEYRLTDDTTFPGILCDALSAWKYLIDQGFHPKDILIAGDSAGANLALSLVRYLIQYHPFYTEWNSGDEIADGIVLFSPWVDLTMSYCEASKYYNSKTDYLSAIAFKGATNALLEGLPKDAASNILLSSLCKARLISQDDFNSFPRSLIFGGSLEILIDEIKDLHHHLDSAAKAGKCKSSTYIEESLAAHDWCALPFGFAKEQERTLQHVAQWI